MAESSATSTIEELLPVEVQKRVTALKDLQARRLTDKETYLAERKALEAKYSAIYQTSYAARAEIVKGAVDPVAADSGEKGIPGFWLKALENHRRLVQTIEEHDVDALTYIEDITCQDDADLTAFTITFKFRENPYFTNSVLSKKLSVSSLLSSNNISIEKSEGTEINWKADKDLTVKLVKKTVRKGKGRPKTVTKAEPVDSFFRYFESNDIPTEDMLKDMEQDEAMELFELIQMEAGVSFALRNTIIPNAVDWFTGEAEDDDDEDDEEEEDDEDDEEDEEAEEDEEDAPQLLEDEEEEEEAPAKGRGGKGGAAGGAKKGGRGNGRGGASAADDVSEKALADAFEKKTSVTGEGATGDEKPPECKQQ